MLQRGLVERLRGARARAVIESMTGARFVHNTLEELGWEVLVADAQKSQRARAACVARPTRSTRGCWPSAALVAAVSAHSQSIGTALPHRACTVVGDSGQRRTIERTDRMFNPIKKAVVGIAALAALALGGSAIAGAATSQKATTTAQSASTTKDPPAFNGPAHGTAAHENAAKAVTGAAATKAQAAAVKSVGSGTAGAVTNDMMGSGFETTVTKSDGSKVEVHLDSSYNVMQGRR